MKKSVINIRELKVEDIPLIADYWLKSSPEFMEKMGVDLNKIPERQSFESMLKSQVLLPINKRRSFCLIWLQNDEPIGHCNTNPTLYGDHAFFHLHIWNPAYRYQGIGIQYLRLCIPLLFEKLHLKNLYSEPFALNNAPNKTLSQLGFTLEKTYITTPGSINFEQKVNRWRLRLDELDKIKKI